MGNRAIDEDAEERLLRYLSGREPFLENEERDTDMATTKTQAKEELHPFIWEQGAVHVLRDAKLMGLHELDDGLAAYLEKCHYQRLPGGVEPLETWATDDPSTPSRFCVVAHYGHITIVVQIQDA